jgi:uncharacterized membrane protein
VSSRRGPFAGFRHVLGSRIAPPRFVLFVGLMIGISSGWALLHATPPGDALVVGFDCAAVAFMVSLGPLLRDRSVAVMRCHAAENDANRPTVLVVTAATALAILAAIAAELPAAREGHLAAIVKLIVTLGLSWAFTNLVFMLHYAHMHYARGPLGPGGEPAGDCGGFDFPSTPEPDYWDFLYFAFTAGMSFAASDVDVTRRAVRRVLVAHSLLSFVFNIGVLAFSINVLAGAAG